MQHDSIESMAYNTTKRGECDELIATNLLLILFVTALLLLGGSGGTLALDTSGTASSVGRGGGEVNVFLGVETNDERWDVDHLLANPGGRK
jgi:hypothetical protein